MKQKHLMKALGLLMVASGLADAQTTIGGAGAALDVTDTTNWTTNNTAYTTTNGGMSLNWENVVANTATGDVTDSFYDCHWQTNNNYTIGHLFMYNQTFDPSTLGAGGITSIDWTADFQSSHTASDNWHPVIAVTDGGVTQYYAWVGGGNVRNGNGAINFGSIGNMASNAFWGEIVPTQGGSDFTNEAINPNINRCTLAGHFFIRKSP